VDAVLVTGDAYIDSPLVGVAVVARTLEAAGYRVGIVAQPDVGNPSDVLRLGVPRLFWGVTAGSVDSMVANWTASGRRRRQDDATAGGRNDRRPDRACIVYANLIRRACRPCPPIVLGGVEASLRRIAHYDFWSDRVRRSILFDAKADAAVYGMADNTVVALANALRDGQDWRALPGVCHIASDPPPDSVRLPSFEEAAADRDAFLRMFRSFAANQEPQTARPLAQAHADRWLVHNPPALPPTPADLDRVHALPFRLEAHPHDAARGEVRALETIRFSLATHRGCYGGCAFCAIAMHQGRQVVSRTVAGILAEAERMTRHPRFRGTIMDVGGPTANMYGYACPRAAAHGACAHRACLFPDVCPHLPVSHAPLTDLLARLRRVPGVRRVFVGSGIRHDLVLADTAHGAAYLDALAAHHVSGQLKVAPEHSEPGVLRLMRKPGVEKLLAFRERFEQASRRAGKKQFLTYYLIAAHPGCSDGDMRRLRAFAERELRLVPEQVQVFTPTPSTWSTAMYWTERDPSDGSAIFVEKNPRRREEQKDELTGREKGGRWGVSRCGTLRAAAGRPGCCPGSMA
jgi:uncharacterized radical SAM protein YgiQ